MEQSTTTTATRPTFLTVLCILSFIAAGLGIFGYLGAIALVSVASTAMSAASDAVGSDAMSAAMGAYSGPSAGMLWTYIAVGITCTLVGLFGVIKMWKLQKVGFYLYAGSAVVALLLSIIVMGFGSSVMSLIFTALFIVLYGLNLKHMK